MRKKRRKFLVNLCLYTIRAIDLNLRCEEMPLRHQTERSGIPGSFLFFHLTGIWLKRDVFLHSELIKNLGRVSVLYVSYCYITQISPIQSSFKTDVKYTFTILRLQSLRTRSKCGENIPQKVPVSLGNPAKTPILQKL